MAELARIAATTPIGLATNDDAAADAFTDEDIEEVVEIARLAIELLAERRGRRVVLEEDVGPRP